MKLKNVDMWTEVCIAERKEQTSQEECMHVCHVCLCYIVALGALNVVCGSNEVRLCPSALIHLRQSRIV